MAAVSFLENMHKMKFAVTGLGLITPLGNDVKTNWRRLTGGETAVVYDKKYEAFISRASGFDIDESKRQNAMADAAMREALEDAGLQSSDNCKGAANIGVIWGESKPNLFRPYLHSALFNLHSFVSAACATGGVAVIKACNLIEGGAFDAVVCGCAETSLHPLYIAAFKKMGVLSKKGPRPFDKDRDGFALGEGAGFIVVENYDKALKRKAKIYCEIAGSACGIFTDNPVNISSCDKMSAIINRALNGQKPDYIHMHATGTRANDYFESLAIARLQSSDTAKTKNSPILPYLNSFVSSTKAASGHLLSVSGMAGTIFSILSIRDGIVAPTLNFKETDISFGLNYVVNQKQVAPVKSALSLSWGFGGQGAAVFLTADKRE
jgi:3-oxoacyl-[acyl-carrier-protein] synthase II